MTLLVADDGRRSLRDVLPADVATVDADSAGDAAAREHPAVVVVDAASVGDPAAVVEDVRANADRTVVVAVGTTATDADVTCAATDEAAVRDAVERARRVSDYRSSISELYEACRDRALGQPDGDVRERRADADRRLEALPEDRESVAAALRSDDADDDDGESDDGVGGSEAGEGDDGWESDDGWEGSDG
ncbi:MAG: hypothetical protein ABEJ90_04360 [Halobacterium sp.]